MTAADHANTLRKYRPRSFGDLEFDAALDALQAQAEEEHREARKWFGIYEEELTRADAAEAERDLLRNEVAMTHRLLLDTRAERDRLADALREAYEWIDRSMHSADDDLEGGHALLNRIAALAQTEHTP